jgi:hypothetical protein
MPCWYHSLFPGKRHNPKRELRKLQTQAITLDKTANDRYKKVQNQKHLANTIRLDDEELEDIMEEYEAV